MKNIYTKEYFIKKFEAIPENEIGKCAIHKHCALYHCGVRTSDNECDGYEKPIPAEAKQLAILLGGDEDLYNVYIINDKGNDNECTAKQNILNALKSL